MLFRKTLEYQALFITNLPSFYKVNLFNELSKTINIKVLFISDKSVIRNADFFSHDIKFDYEILTKLPYEKRNSLLVGGAILKRIFLTKYKKIIYSGWESKELILFPFLTAKKKNGIVIESSILETNVKGWLWFVKKMIINRMTFAYPSGILQREILNKAKFSGHIYVTHGVGISNFQKIKSIAAEKKIPNKNKLKFLYVGRLSKEKNLSMLVEVFTQTEHELIIAGNGDEYLDLLGKSANNICFLGYVENKNLPKIYQNCDCFILPSLSEPWGLVVEEALSMGLPVILSNKVGCYEDMISTSNGIVFDALDSSSLRNAINKMAKNIERYQAGAASYEPLENQQKQLAAYQRSLR